MVGTGNGLAKVYYDPVKSHRYVQLFAFILTVILILSKHVIEDRMKNMSKSNTVAVNNTVINMASVIILLKLET